MSSPTRVDVLIAVRAPAPWLNQTLDSLNKQSFEGWALILVMDGFAEEIRRVCEQTQPGCSPLVVPDGSGMVAALNSGLAACQSEYIARIDADDVALPGRLAAQVAYLDSHPDCIAVGTGYQTIDEEGNVLAEQPMTMRDPVRALRWYNPLAHPSMMIRRSALVAAGGYNPAARHLEDYDLWLRLAATGTLGVIREPLLQYRQHGGQVTKRFGYTPEARSTLRASRIALAQAEGTSPVAARFRQHVWSTVNRVKGR
jgi:glycosyltransferase involved in cell wall biosynthesis